MSGYIGYSFVLGDTIHMETVVPVASAKDEFGIVRNGEHLRGKTEPWHEGTRQPFSSSEVKHLIFQYSGFYKLLHKVQDKYYGPQ